MTTCVVADDHPSVLASVTGLLREWGFDVRATAPSGPIALRTIEELRPDVALVDAQLPGLSGLDLVRQARRTAPGTAIAIYTGHPQRALIHEAMDAGARAVILKDAPLGDLRRALDSIAGGDIYLDPAVGGALLLSRDAPKLTERERDVLRLLADGYRTEEIGRRLFISEHTVRAHVAKATTRLGARTRTQAVAIALRSGLIA
ncbi:MAG TPA: response regulator transcription factor [Gaiellaceae bacterium]|nr:response regulator transcription factor [Gaiellaceae bacterium]